MKKVLIISYFYPPCHFVGGQRIASWVNFLPENGIYPIVITRQWNQGQKELTDKIYNNKLCVEVKDTHQVHRLPYKRSLRDRFSKYPVLKPFQKLLTLIEVFFSIFTIQALPYSNFFDYTKKLLSKNPDIKVVIISGRPFHSFHLGFKLKKSFPSVEWIPDYRDEWSSFQNNAAQPISNRLLSFFDLKAEKKWTSNAHSFITVSETWSQSIGSLIGKKGWVVFNGFNAAEKLPYKILNKDLLILSYVGTLYPNQEIEILLQSIQKLKNDKIIIQFFGVEMNADQEKRLQNYALKNIIIRPRLERKELIKELANTDLFVLTGYRGVKGWFPVKLFDYYNWHRPIILCPSDNDVLQKFIIDSNAGFIVNDEKECDKLLNELFLKKSSGEEIILDRNETFGEKFSRKNQAKELAKILESIIR